MNEVWIKAVEVSGHGNGTQALPFSVDGPDRLDTLLGSFPENTVIHFLPGEYRTRGFHEGAASLADVWQPKRGWKLIGSGMDITTLKLVDAAQHSDRYSAIGTTYDRNADGLEISDMTVDANGVGNSGKSAFQCIAVHGSHVRLHRVKGIGWGARGEHEAFAIGANGGHAHPAVGRKRGNIIEDCVFVEPCGRIPVPLDGPPDVDPGCSVFCIFGGDSAEILHDAPIMRRNFADGTGANNVRAYSMGGVTAGLVEENSATNCHHGFYLDSAALNHGLTISRNRFLRVIQGVGFNYHQRDPLTIESQVDIIENWMTLRDGPGASGVGLLGTKREGPVTFNRARIIGNNIGPVAASGDIAGIAVFRAGSVEVVENNITLPSENRRIDLKKVGSWRVVDQYQAA